MNTFQIVLIGFFIFALVIGVLIFAGVLPGFRAPSGGAGGTVVWWGTIPTGKLTSLLEKIRHDYASDFNLQYIERDPRTIETDLLEALALGRGPDLVTLPSDVLVAEAAKLQPIPYGTLSRQTFQNTFVIGSHIRDWEFFLGANGAIGLPLYLDPLVLYSNQDLLANARVALVPKTWKEVADVIPLLTKTDGRGNINQSAIAVGSFNNIEHAKDILALLMMQAGNPIVARENGAPAVRLKDTLGFNQPPAGEALNFFLRFVDPANTLYSWNSSQTEARDNFVRGKLAMYLGWGSETSRLTAQNPQLNFYLTLPPQRDGSGRDLTIGRFYFLALARGAKNPSTALKVAMLLADTDLNQLIATAAGLPPARSDLLQEVPADPEQAVLYQAAIVTRDWLDPARDKTQALFRQLVENVAQGRVDIAQALSNADTELRNLLPKDETN